MSDDTIRTLPEVPFAAPALSSRREHLVRAGARLWRVHDARGAVRGHLRLLEGPLGMHYRAERLHLPSGGFRVVGDFWRADDAVAALRNG
ncbi:hypothetical protein [Microbacterium sp.]|uniref:hypothetical protein n=1 Tax=Microbacterium sp. TaxID=51671 RepID=UPI0039E60C17